eukprot:GEMP01008929.1.p1 GENE.GEMP01008929.1~~GEMP01008929.1.p1  ORF type:complete len:390 (+),score=69.46 GEMP01008929.1:433-1602(+)
MIGVPGRLNSSSMMNKPPMPNFGTDPAFSLNKGGFSAPHLPFAPMGQITTMGPAAIAMPRAVMQAVNVQTMSPKSITQSFPDPRQTSEPDGKIPIRASAGLVDETRERAEEVKVNMEQIIGVLTSLATSHSNLKTKYLQTRRSSLEKYFVENKRILLVTAFMEWKAIKNAIAHARRHSLVVDQLYQERETHTNLRQELEGAFERKVDDIQSEARKSIVNVEDQSKKTVGTIKDELKVKTALLEQLQKENENLRARLGGQHLVMSSIRQQIETLEEPPRKKLPSSLLSATEDSFSGQEPTVYVRDKLHDILFHIDPKYVPPLKHAISLDSTHPAQSPQSSQFGKISVQSGASPRYKTSSAIRSQSSNIQPKLQQNRQQVVFVPSGFNRPM